ncbi:MAG: M20/M25/M40 family metallo-hydrolase [Acidobacteria bacterium]|nr:M20/M25/M40 family metallo-hydrolase [Acidobacteriota bacterium]
MLKRKLFSVFMLYAFLLPGFVFAQTPSSTASATAAVAAPAPYQAPKEVIDKIKEEGSKNSQVMRTLSYLTDVIGGRLTGSPAMKRANEWTRDQMTKWGLQNARLEAWGPFGRGWTLKNFDAQIVAPSDIPLIAYPKAWSPSTNGTITADVVYFAPKTDADYEKYKGQLRGKIVLVSDERELKANFEPMGSRRTDEELAKMAEAPDPATVPRNNTGITPERMKMFMDRFVQGAKRMNFLLQEGAAVMVDNSFNGSGGTVFVQQANVAQEIPKSMEEYFSGKRLPPQQKEAESKMIPQITLATEHYNRLARMIKFGEKLKMAVNIQAEYDDKDPMAYNTIAEIPGSDPRIKDEIVMLGGHMDSWHAGTGATDNAAGVAVAMEAARIIQSLGLKPRRTIRVALWSGEEQGLLGSQAYVKQHFGEMKGGDMFSMMAGSEKTLQFVKQADYEKLSAYYNLDNGTGKIRGVHLQGNAAVAPIFRAWLEPFKEMGATTVTLSNTGGTDHLSYDRIGLPGFQFIQDEIEYDARTHHSNQDVFDRIQADDMKQAATIMAAFVYQTAMMDEKIPRKAVK